MRKQSYVHNVDELIAKTDVRAAAARLGRPLPARDRGEVRIPCVFDEKCHTSSYGNLAINLDEPQTPIYCHTCQTRGNLLTLLWGIRHGRAPSGGKLRGNEFREAVRLLLEVNGQSAGEASGASQPPIAAPPAEVPRPAVPTTAVATAPPERNVPLRESPNERARELVTLHEQFVVDVEAMSPRAASYFRRRPWLTPELARRFRMGYLPQDARSLLRGSIVYAFADERNEILSYFSRDPAFEEKLTAWEAAGRPPDDRPMKHRFVKGFFRGQELYGQHGSHRLQQDRRLRESLGRIGLCVVEGPNDVMRLDDLGVAGVGLCSNRATEAQLSKLVGYARALCRGRIVLLPDNDSEGEDGFKDLLWTLAQHEGIDVRLGWGSATHGGQFAGRQPESLSLEEWHEAILPRLDR